MIISATPFRISFFGGGTDYPVWSKRFGGAVLSTTIDKYCYLNCRYLPPFFKHKSRIVWSQIESVKETGEIKHPSARETIRYMNFDKGLEIHHDADLPARTGIGSSSSFTVGLLNSLYALKGKMISKKELAETAIHIEQHILQENVGFQDQIAASYGGLNKIVFKPDGSFQVFPVILDNERIGKFQNHLMLFYTGISRTASQIAKTQIQVTHKKREVLDSMKDMVDASISILSSKKDITLFGELLHESWMLKRSITNKISNTHIDNIYKKARKSGAIGGKLCGAGGGGFILLFVRPKDHIRVKKTLKDLLYVPFKLENMGSKIIFYQPNIS